MQAAVCPACLAFVGYVPDGWRTHIIHHENPVRHALMTERPDIPFPPEAFRPNPD